MIVWNEEYSWDVCACIVGAYEMLVHTYELDVNEPELKKGDNSVPKKYGKFPMTVTMQININSTTPKCDSVSRYDILFFAYKQFLGHK